jgi:chromate transporter
VRRVFHALKPAVVALIAVPLINLARSANLGWDSFWVPLAAVFLVGFLQVSPVWLILLTIAFAVGQSLVLKRKLK